MVCYAGCHLQVGRNAAIYPPVDLSHARRSKTANFRAAGMVTMNRTKRHAGSQTHWLT